MVKKIHKSILIYNTVAKVVIGNRSNCRVSIFLIIVIRPYVSAKRIERKAFSFVSDDGGGRCILIKLPIPSSRPVVSILIIELASALSAGDTYFISVK